MLRKKYIKSSRDIRKIPYDLVSELVILRDYVDTSEAYLNEEHKLLVDLADGLYNNGWIDEIVSKMKSTYPEIFDKYGDDYFELILEDCSAIDSQIRPNNVQDLIDEYLAKAEEFSGSVDIESATDVCSAKMYELSPSDGRKSFYGKAKVMIEDDGSETLYSYGTPIIRRKPNGDLDPLWDGYSATTGRHIASFAGLNKKQYMDLLKKKQDVESSEKIECVGHNDPGRYFDLVDYYDVWGNEEDGWEVNNLGVIEEGIWISDDTTEEELFNYLRDTIGYFNKDVKFSDVEIIWDSPEFIEFFDASNGYPLGRLQESYNK